MIPPAEPVTGPAALVARWRTDALVLRRYGALGRARMLERMATELEEAIAGAAESVVTLHVAADLSGFTRSHLRRLYRDGKLIPARTEAGEPLFRVSDLPRKPGKPPVEQRSRTQIAREIIGTQSRPRRSRNRQA